MKNRVSHFTLRLAALLIMASALVGQAEIVLDGYYSDNMVLHQEGKYVVLGGRASLGATVTADFRGKVKPSKVKSDPANKERGVWEIKLPVDEVKNGPGKLVLTETFRGKQLDQVTYGNVAIGRIWWLGVRGQGLTARSETLAKFKDDRVRLVDQADTRQFSGWVSLTQPGGDAQIMNAFCLEAVPYLGPGYVGIVQTSPDLLRRLGIDNPSWQKPQALPWLNDLQKKLNEEVRKEQVAIQRVLAEAKHAGVITNVPSRTTYYISNARWRDKTFAPAEPWQKDFWRGKNFEAAVW